ncbi:DUF4296 domain-containing protein [Chryseobacterium vrystaatense]|uniref:DUF4296 domain-containing protein n=1 Tax=Chryseobacterium vrystaatense TaxID=307480 RepID=A0A1M4VGT4_9FLAO|nr:DUF4296 domain-containing protein [Chryseobacterium vrystaatense]KFF28018.1 hypothetical protein IW16_02020 [Chryseobacterium vrystaatense]SHE68181.1 protein of unknown function [Chryseobacterium vrystaatense]
MKKLVFIFITLCMFSCGDYIDKPKNLIEPAVMAEILADLAVADQAVSLYPNKNLEAGTRFVLKTHKVKPDDFVASFKYYVIKDKMKDIAEDAQKIVVEKDPKADKYIKDKLKKTENTPFLVR